MQFVIQCRIILNPLLSDEFVRWGWKLRGFLSLQTEYMYTVRAKLATIGWDAFSSLAS